MYANRPLGGPRRSWYRLGSVLFSSCSLGSLFSPSRAPLGVVLGRFGRRFGPSWARFGSSWALLGSFLGTPDGMFESYNPKFPSTHQPINPSTHAIIPSSYLHSCHHPINPMKSSHQPININPSTHPLILSSHHPINPSTHPINPSTHPIIPSTLWSFQLLSSLFPWPFSTLQRGPADCAKRLNKEKQWKKQT